MTLSPIKVQIIGIMFLVVVGYGFGRYAQPAKVVTETKVVEVEKKTTETEAERNRHKTTVTHEVTKPDGSQEKTTTTEESTETVKKGSSTSDTATETAFRSETTYKDSINLSLLAGAGSLSGPIVYGGAATKRIIGPITGGAWALTSGVVGVSIGLSF